MNEMTEKFSGQNSGKELVDEVIIVGHSSSYFGGLCGFMGLSWLFGHI
jgi:hypothetical protein